jgi:Tfp pilus assembly protein PilF
VREGYDKAQADARQALALAPDLAEAHLALAIVFDSTLDFTQASGAYERRSPAQAIPRSAGRCMRPAAMRRRLRLTPK